MASVRADNDSVAVNNSGNGTVTINMAAQLAQLPSVLTPLLLQIVQHHKPKFDPNILLEKSPEIEEKLLFNCLNYISDDIRRNSEFMALVEESLSIVDDAEPGAKGAIQWTINKAYKSVKLRLLMQNKVSISNKDEVQRIISKHADEIYLEVSEALFSIADIGILCTKESLMAAKELLACYGFIGCMILEEPTK
ncbi:hypothetical protein [Pantoea sp. A4]|uniref:hypothetical protein n=1 Tax=Pantoea sp. A4 TaxID=1225184 RepID=UPI0003706FE6|nr:hypothetical protein [Pantoea sp. A4]